MKKNVAVIVLIGVISLLVAVWYFNTSQLPEETYIEAGIFKQKDIFTEKELEWIQANKDRIFTVGTAKDYIPIEYLNDQWKPSGLGTEVLRYVNEVTGLKFKLHNDIYTSTWNDVLDMAYNQEIDILSTVSHTEERDKRIHFTKPFAKTTLVIVGNKDNPEVLNSLCSDALKNKIFVTPKGYWIQDIISKKNPSAKIVMVDDTKESFKYINEKKADYTICDIPIYTYYKEQGLFRNIKIIGELKDKNTIMVGVRKGLEPLVGIINKTIDTINQDQLYEKAMVMPKTNMKEKRMMVIILILSGLLLAAGYYLFITFKHLIEAKKEAEAANEEKSRFMMNISHDLRTPITVVLGYTEAIIDGQVGTWEAMEKYVRRIHKRTKYLSELINDFFIISKIEDKEFNLHKEKVNINVLINYIIDDMELDFQGKHIIVKKHLDERISNHIEIDRLKICRAIENIISNAIKHSQEASIIELSTKLLENDRIQIKIKDEGDGIREEDKEHIFKRYYKGKSNCNSNESIGLGLYITKEIVEKHGGEIWVESEEGKGSTFFIVL